MATAYADPADTLEDKYVKGLTKYKAEYDAKCRRLSLAYIKSLEKLQVATVKKGDLDGALKVKAKIAEIEKLLADNLSIPLPNPTKTIVSTKPDPIIGKWNWSGRVNYTFKADGTFISNTTVHGAWESLGNAKYKVRGIKNGSTFFNLITLKSETIFITDIRGNNGRTRKRIAIDSVVESRQ